ncbi:hypothetical protein AC579_4022 [Pseudocercospora musae]|uniref:Uncharacterized protein n=1 Tax=Pseudocercospora musae TaxID=113226 RepID=A0A139I2P6_9PEZI|nr:hypothetical protein AC579_4022 [Pseudocercospora musae]
MTVRNSVPELWTPEACGRMQAAAGDLCDELVYMAENRFRDGQRTRTAGGKNESFKRLYPWTTVTIPLDATELEKHDFDSGTDENGEEYWFLCVWAKVKWDGRCMSLSYDILEKCEEKVPWERRKVVMTKEGEVYDPRFSPFHKSVGI